MNHPIPNKNWLYEVPSDQPILCKECGRAFNSMFVYEQQDKPPIYFLMCNWCSDTGTEWEIQELLSAQDITINQAFLSEADRDTRFEVGDQTLWNDIHTNLPLNRRRQFNFNHIRREEK